MTADLSLRTELLVDQGLISYDDAYRLDGVETASDDELSAAAITARTGNLALIGTETVVAFSIPRNNPKYGINEKAWGQAVTDPVIQARTERGIAQARAAIAHTGRQ